MFVLVVVPREKGGTIGACGGAVGEAVGISGVVFERLEQCLAVGVVIAGAGSAVRLQGTRPPNYILSPNPPPADLSLPPRELLRPGCFPLPWQ
jgi:hypothetical protein